MTQLKDELKPCIFCGKKVEKQVAEGPWESDRIYCPWCFATVYFSDRSEDIIYLYNHQLTSLTLEAQRDELLDALKFSLEYTESIILGNNKFTANDFYENVTVIIKRITGKRVEEGI